MEGEGIEILAENIEKKDFIRKISFQTEEHNTMYGTEVELSMWIGFIWLRMSLSDEIHNIQFAQEVSNLFHSLFILKYSVPLIRMN